MNRDRDVVVVAGVRTPFTKVGTLLGRTPAVELGRVVVREAIERAEVDPAAVDEVIVGNVAGPPDAANVASACGSGVSLSVTSVIIPSVPKDPTNSLHIS